MGGVSVRPMVVEDLDGARLVLTDTFGALMARGEHRDPVWLGRWRVRATHLLTTDPGGCWVAELEDGIVGFALSIRRESTWALSGYAVRTDLQGRGIGRMLLGAAESHGADCPRALLSSSSDPGALARYRAAGFTLYPQRRFTGVVTHADSGATTARGLRPGTGDDLPWFDVLDRQVRGAAHGPDHELLLTQFPSAWVLERNGGAGYAYLDSDGAPVLLCASDTSTAGALLDLALRSVAPGTEISVAHVTEANPWASERCRAAGLSEQPNGFLAVRGMEPPAPYLHHGALL